MGGQEHTGDTPQHLAPVLDALRSDPARVAYYRDLLRPLRQYDLEHHGDLVRTLAAYLRHGGNSTQAANALYLHRNSLRYRLARIQVLLSLDPDDPDARLALQIALLISTED